jgi:hypothetical protein
MEPRPWAHAAREAAILDAEARALDWYAHQQARNQDDQAADGEAREEAVDMQEESIDAPELSTSA